MEQRRFKLFLLLLSFIFLILLAEGVYYWRLVKKTQVVTFPVTTSTQTPTRRPTQVAVGEYVTTENLWTYVEPNEATRRGYLIPGRTFEVVEQKGEWVRIEVYEPHFDMTWEGWIKISDPGYQPKE